MKYQTASVGRVFVCRLNDGDDLLKCLVELVKHEGVRAAVFHVVGGIKGGKIVVGPETESMPPNPVYREISESHEVTGMGTIFYKEGQPSVHFHGAFGKRDTVRVGCLREFSETFIVLEAIVTELNGIEAERRLDPVTGMYLLSI
ncbi:MAG: DNA-binding protein [Nitrospirae bacterium]|nr:DNA-binding protein [Nitrospirota bacterium]